MLAVLGALAAMTLPEFERLYVRVRVAFEREDLERQLLELPQRARDCGCGGILANADKGDHSEGEAAAAVASPVSEFESWQPLLLKLPTDWIMQVPKPIHYHISGACDGGEVIFSLLDQSLRYVLSPPLCRPRLANAE